LSVFPQIEKLKNNAIIDRVFKEGRRVQSGYLAMHYLKSEETGGVIFINVAVSKKEVCLSVNRNKIKRKMRACIIHRQEPIKKNLHSGYYIVLFKEKGVESFSSILKNFDKLFERLSTKK